ncbi:hypothetical protein H4I95_01803 [Botrytis cinerea]
MKSPQSTSKGNTSPDWHSHESSPENAPFKPAREYGHIAAEASNEEDSHHQSEFAHKTNSYSIFFSAVENTDQLEKHFAESSKPNSFHQDLCFTQRSELRKQ